MKRQIRRLMPVAVILLLMLLVGISPINNANIDTLLDYLEANQPGLYRVVKVHDGDTIDVRMSGHIETVRMIGIDTPETHHPDKPLQCYGREATTFTQQLLAERYVRLEADPTNTNRDRYDRLLRYVYLPDGTLVNARLIEDGYGFAYVSFPFIKTDQFIELEKQAQHRLMGLWSACRVVMSDGFLQTVPVE